MIRAYIGSFTLIQIIAIFLKLKTNVGHIQQWQGEPVTGYIKVQTIDCVSFIQLSKYVEISKIYKYKRYI